MQRLVVYLDDLKPDSRDVSLCSSLFSANTLNQNLVVLVYESLGEISGNKGCYYLAVLFQLDLAAFSHGRVWLLRLFLDFLQDNSLCLACPLERICLCIKIEGFRFIFPVAPSEFLPVFLEFQGT